MPNNAMPQQPTAGSMPRNAAPQTFAAGNVELKQIRGEAAEVLNLKLEPPPQLSKTADHQQHGHMGRKF
jgi:hypothetical protein